MTILDNLKTTNPRCAALRRLGITKPYVIRNSGVLMPVRQRMIADGITPIVWAINTNHEPFASHPLGVIYPFAGRPPKGWLPFDGRRISQQQHPDLFRYTGLKGFPDVALVMRGTYPAIDGYTHPWPGTFGDGHKLMS